MDESIMATVEESNAYDDFSAPQPRRHARLKRNMVAAVAALTGGLAAAWYYRKTLSRLQQTVAGDDNSNFWMPEPHDRE